MHPQQSKYYINRGILSSHKFQLMTLHRVNSGSGELDSKHENVNVPDLIATQKGIFVKVLRNVIETLQEIDERYTQIETLSLE